MQGAQVQPLVGVLDLHAATKSLHAAMKTQCSEKKENSYRLKFLW